MSRKLFVQISILAVLFVSTGCIGGPGPEDFAGTWQGTETATVSINGESDTVTEPNVTLVLSEGSSADVILDLSEEGFNCIMRGNIEDDVLEFDTTTCTESDSGITGTYTLSGDAELNDDELTVDIDGTLTLTGPGGSASGTFLYGFDGERL